MNYYGPRQRESDKQWDYTCMNDGNIWPVGYCHAYRSLEGDPMVSKETADQYAATAHKHHTNGHETPQEACECYREYLLDHQLQLGQEYAGTQSQCVVCGAWSSMFAGVGPMLRWDLCAEHNNRAEVEKLFEAPGEVISSW